MTTGPNTYSIWRCYVETALGGRRTCRHVPLSKTPNQRHIAPVLNPFIGLKFLSAFSARLLTMLFKPFKLIIITIYSISNHQRLFALYNTLLHPYASSFIIY